MAKRVLLVVVSCAAVAHADPSKLMPAADLVGTSIDVDANGRVQGYEDRFAVAAPLPRWDGGGGALTFGRMGTSVFDRETGEYHMHSYRLGLVGGQSIGHGLILAGGFTATYASALDHYTADAWQLMVNGTVAWKYGDSDGFIAGAVYTSTNTLWIPLIPVLGWVHHAPDSPWRFDVLLPRGVRIDRALGPRSTLGGILDVTGGSWAARTRDTMVASPVTARQLRGTLAARYQVKLFGPFRLDARVGMMIEQLEIPTAMDTSTLPIRPAAYGQLGIAAGP